MERQYWKTPTNSGMAKSAKEKQHKFALVKVGRGGGGGGDGRLLHTWFDH